MGEFHYKHNIFSFIYMYSGVVHTYLSDHLGSRLYDLQQDEDLQEKTRQFETRVYGSTPLKQNVKSFLPQITVKTKAIAIIVLCIVSTNSTFKKFTLSFLLNNPFKIMLYNSTYFFGGCLAASTLCILV